MKGNAIDKAKPGPTFDGESMRAIIAGRKTQTRRVLKVGDMVDSVTLSENGRCGVTRYTMGMFDVVSVKPLPYRVGGVYYARESLCKGPVGSFGNGTPDDECCLYAADGSTVTGPNGGGWSVHWPWNRRVLAPHCMPRWAARVWLRIVDVRVQRLGEIADFDAAREGCWSPLRMCGSSVKVFADRWESIHKPGSWERDRNKWVAAYTFEILEKGELDG